MLHYLYYILARGISGYTYVNFRDEWRFVSVQIGHSSVPVFYVYSLKVLGSLEGV